MRALVGQVKDGVLQLAPRLRLPLQLGILRAEPLAVRDHALDWRGRSVKGAQARGGAGVAWRHAPSSRVLRELVEVMTMEWHPVDSHPAHATRPRPDVAALYALFLAAISKLIHCG